MTTPHMSFGWRAYPVSAVGREVTLAAAFTVGWWFAHTHTGPLLGNGLTAALVPVGFLMVFGFGYASDTFSTRLARYGPERETPTTVLILFLFVVAVLTVTLILGYLALADSEYLCFGPCDFSILPPGFDTPWNPLILTHNRLGQYATAGVTAVLAGSAQLLFSLLRPRKSDYSIVFDLRRIGGRILDIVILLALTVGVYKLGIEVLLDNSSETSPARWILGALFVAVPFLYEFLPRVLPRCSGKWWPWLRIVSAPNGGTVVWWRFALRALVTSFAFSFGADLAVAFWALTISYEPWLVIARVVLLVCIFAATVHPRGQGIHDVLLRTHVRDKTADTEAGGRSPTGGQPPSSRWLSLRPRPFVADKSAPFANDLLGRQPQVEALSAVVMCTDRHATLLVDAPWGGGKTAFLRMCAAYLRSHDLTVVEFNAWTDQYTKRPLLDLIGALSARLPSAASGRISSGASDLVALLNAAQPDPRVVSWDDHRRAVECFTSSLADVVDEQDRIVVVVDELDRCQPDYAIQLLAEIHHLFSVDGLVVLLGVNRGELCESVRSVYGDDFNADSYLRRFADQPVDLPSPTRTDLEKFMEHLYRETGLDTRLRADSYTRLMLEVLIGPDDRTLRDLEQFVFRVAVVLASIPRASDDPANSDVRWVGEQATMTLLVLREKDRAAYRRFINGEDDALATGTVLRQHLAAENTVLLRMELVLLLITHRRQNQVAEWDIWQRHRIHRSEDQLSELQGLCTHFLNRQGIALSMGVPEPQRLAALIEMTHFDPRNRPSGSDASEEQGDTHSVLYS